MLFETKHLAPPVLPVVTGQDHIVVRVGDLWNCLAQGIDHIPYAKVYVSGIKLSDRVKLTDRHTDRRTKLKQYVPIIPSGA